MIKLLSWNILQGGGRRTDDIIAFMQSLDADIVVLQEFRNGAHGDRIRDALAQKKLSHQFVADVEQGRDNTLFIASRDAFDAGDFVPDRTGPCHIVEASFSDLALTLLNIHFPQKEAQRPLFDLLEADTPSLLDGPVLMLGDMNCGIPYVDSDGKTFQNAARFQNLLDAGWVDCWRGRNDRGREFTWVSPRTGNRFRYDHAFASAQVDQDIVSIRYAHEVRERKMSDHSALIIELDLP